MARWRNWLLALFCAVMVLSPALADARAGGSFRGGGSSYSGSGTSGGWGSRGSGYNNPNPAYYNDRNIGFAQRHPFLTGMAGWFFASWLGSLLFPHWGMGFGGAFGSLITWLLIIFGVSLLFRWFRRGGAAMTAPYLRGGDDAPMPRGGGYRPAPRRDIAIDAHDQAAFEAILKAVQDAWSKGDLGAIGHYVTPEMYGYFRDNLQTYQSQGVANRVEQVQLVNGDVREAWDDGTQQYATCLLQWRALDYTHRLDRKPGDAGWLVEGDPQHPADAQEIWTFARRPGGHWLLSAIEQV
jgi:predicted lipid-binding transport protein (Tim44 family)